MSPTKVTGCRARLAGGIAWPIGLVWLAVAVSAWAWCRAHSWLCSWSRANASDRVLAASRDRGSVLPLYTPQRGVITGAQTTPEPQAARYAGWLRRPKVCGLAPWPVPAMAPVHRGSSGLPVVPQGTSGLCGGSAERGVDSGRLDALRCRMALQTAAQAPEGGGTAAACDRADGTTSEPDGSCKGSRARTRATAGVARLLAACDRNPSSHRQYGRSDTRLSGGVAAVPPAVPVGFATGLPRATFRTPPPARQANGPERTAGPAAAENLGPGGPELWSPERARYATRAAVVLATMPIPSHPYDVAVDAPTTTRATVARPLPRLARRSRPVACFSRERVDQASLDDATGRRWYRPVRSRTVRLPELRVGPNHGVANDVDRAPAGRAAVGRRPPSRRSRTARPEWETA